MKDSDFLRGYIVCALWSSIDEQPDGNGGPPLDDKYSREDLAPETVKEMRAECAAFLFKARHLITRADEGYNLERAGHDFWLTRNGHGAGFWDRDELRGARGSLLSELADAAGSSDMYVGDNGRLYVQ